MTLTGDKNTPICGPGKLQCVGQIEEKIVNLTFLEHLSDDSEKICKCLPSCTSIHYDVEISQAKFDFNKFMFETTPSLKYISP